MENDEFRSYWSVLPGEIVHDKSLPIAAKYLYVILSSMAYKNGFCWPSNESIAGEMGLSKRRVVELLAMLRDARYIRVVFKSYGKSERRYIYCGMFPERTDIEPDGEDGCEDSHGGGAEDCVPPCENSHTPHAKNTFAISSRNKKEEKQKEIIPPESPKGDKPAKGSRRRGAKIAPDWKPERFEGFWQLYPVKKSKQAAIRAWDSLHPDNALLAVMGRALQRQLSSQDWQRKLRDEGGQGIPYPATWINGRRWEDEDRPARAGPTPPAMTPERFGWD